VVFLVGAATMYHRVALLDTEAVILAEQAEARFEPMEKATTYFTLYEGMKVTVLQSRKGWMKVRRGDGKSGWIRTEDTEMI
jgi:SH3-like domain-containing protein